MMRVSSLLLAVGVVCTVIAGCSSSPDEVSATLGGTSDGMSTSMPSTTAVESGTDPCDLLAPDEVAVALGAEVGEGTAGSGGDCSWSVDGGSTSVVVVVEAGTEACALRRTEDVVPVEGLAGEAWWEFFAESTAGSVTVCLVDEVRTVTVTADAAAPTDEDTLRGQAESLAVAASAS